MEAKFTRCPHCKTVFRLLPNQLAAAQGRVRCGACLQVFPADLHLVRPVQKPINAEPAKPIAPEPLVHPVVNVPVAPIAVAATPVTESPPPEKLPAEPAISEAAVAASHNAVEQAQPVAASATETSADPWANFGHSALEQADDNDTETELDQPQAADEVIDIDAFAETHIIDEISAPVNEIDDDVVAPIEPVEPEPAPHVFQAEVDIVPPAYEPPAMSAVDHSDDDLRFDDDNGLRAEDAANEPHEIEKIVAPSRHTSPDLDDEFISFEVRGDVPADTTGLPSDWFSGSPLEHEITDFQPSDKPGGDFGAGNSELKQTPVQSSNKAVNTPPKTAAHGHWQGEHVYGLQEDPLPLPAEHDGWHIEPLAHSAEPQFYDLPSTAPKWPWKGLALLAIALLLIGLLVSQILWPKRVEWREDEQWGPYVESLCQTIDCELPARRNVKKIALVQKASVVKDPRDPKKLKIDLLMQNSATFEQVFPDIELTFTDIDGQTVATRRFQPSEYLGKDEPPTIMPMQVPVHISFVVMEPKPTVTGFEFAFLPSTENTTP